MHIKVLGDGCPLCRQLIATAEQAVRELGVDATVEHVGDPTEIVKHGFTTAPLLVVDEQVRLAGTTSSVDEIKRILGGRA